MKKKLLLLPILFSFFITFSQTYVPDDAFEQELINLGYDNILDDYVTTSNISNVQQLTLSNSNIREITGIEDFTSLKSLNLSDLSFLTVRNIDLSQLTLLEDLRIDEVNLTSLNLTANTELKKINLGHLDALDTIDLSTNSKIKEIYFIELWLRALDLSNQAALEKLQIFQTYSFNSLDLTNNTQLVIFDSDQINITKLDFSKSTKLEKVFCYDCPLSEVNLKNGFNTILTELRLGGSNTCVQVDDVNYALSQPNWTIFTSSSYSIDCNPDSDNDGVPDTMDSCPNTPAGSFVDSTGCTISLADLVLENIQISIGSTPCSAETNGYISLKSLKNFPLNISIIKGDNDEIFQGILNKSNPVSITDLDEGDYKIIVDGTNIATTDFIWDVSFRSESNEIATTVAITKPNQTYNVGVAGSTQYEINVNDTVTTQEFDSTEEQQIEIPLVVGVNEIVVTGTIDCEAETKRTYVPDNSFEQTLIDLGHDDVLDDYVLTKNIKNLNSISNTSSTNLPITDLTGIEDFTELKTLLLGNYFGGKIDLSQNINLELIVFNNMPHLEELLFPTTPTLTDMAYRDIPSIRTLDIATLPNLEKFVATDVKIIELDVSNNLNLKEISIYNSELIELDLSKNKKIERVHIGNSNFLNKVNLKNGNNQALTTLNLTDTPNLECVQVDDVTYALNQTSWHIDNTAEYSEDCYIPSAYTYVPDDAFEQELINLGYDTVLDDYVRTSNIEQVLELDLPASSINDLTGLEDFKNLKTFNLEDIRPGLDLEDLDLSPLIQLEELRIDDVVGIVASLNLTANTKLKKLTLGSFTDLRELDLTTNTKLQELNLRSLALTSLDISNQSELKLISLENIYTLNTLDVSTNTELNTFEAARININQLDFSNNTKLSAISCFDCGLTAVNLKNEYNLNLNQLNLTSNQIDCVQVDNMDFALSSPNWHIDATASYSENCDAEVERTFVPDDAFEQTLIDLGYDDVLDDTVVTANIKNVQQLSLSNNNIQDLRGLEAFTGLKSLEIKNISNLSTGNISTYTINLSTLEQLVNLKIDKVSNIYFLNLTKNTELKTIHLEELNSAALTTIDFSANTKLKDIYLFDLMLNELDLSHQADLESLQLYNMFSFNTLDLSHNKKLVVFNSGQLSISQLDFSNNTKIEKVACDLCSLSNVNLKNGFNATLTEVDLQDENICVQVDNVNNAESQSNWVIDPSSSYSEDCSGENSSDNDESGKSSENLVVFPTLSDGLITIQNSKQKHIHGITVTSLNGTEARYKYIGSNPEEMEVNMTGAAKGMYVIRIQQAEGAAIVRKILIK